MGRATQGVRIINLEKRGDAIASVCCVDADPEEEVESVAADAEELPELSIEPETDEEATEDEAEESEETEE